MAIMINLAQYRLEESLGPHIVLSNLFWSVSTILVIVAYRYRRLWNVGDTPWTFLLLTFLCFWIRELGHLSTSPFISAIRYTFGIWSAVFMASAFIYLCSKICRGRKDSRIFTYAPFMLAAIFPFMIFYLYLLGADIIVIKNIMSVVESIVWMISSSFIIYTTYMLGTHAPGRFTGVYMFFQFSAFAAFIWKLLGLMESMGYPTPYFIREIIETVFGLFAIASMYLLAGMLRRLSKHINSE